MTVVAVTGISGYLGGLLTAELDACAQVSDIIGIDLVAPESRSAKLRFHRADIRDASVAGLFEGADVVCHLAFVVSEPRDKRRAWSVNVEGTRCVLASAVDAGVPRIVVTSSIAAYGAHASNPVPMGEDQPVRGNRDSYYAAAKAAVEEACDLLEEAHPEVTLTRLRPCIVMGPRASRFEHAVFDRRLLFSVGAGTRYQMLAECDLASGLLAAVLAGRGGAFNLAPDDWVTAGEAARALGARLVTLPYPVAKGMANLLFGLRLFPVSGDWVTLLRYPIIASNAKAKRLLGWQPTLSTAEVIASFKGGGSTNVKG